MVLRPPGDEARCSWRYPTAQPRAGTVAAAALAGVERGLTGRLPASMPRSGSGAGKPFGSLGEIEVQDAFLNHRWSAVGLAATAVAANRGGIDPQASSRGGCSGPGDH